MSQQITDQYIIDILQLLKNLAFHERFMQKLREQLADNIHFDSFTAFKTIDSFKHNMIVNVELKSFLEMDGYEVTNAQAQEAINAINKGDDSLNYDRFIEMIMPYDIRKRNLSLARYNKLQVGIGTFDLVNSIKHTSREQIGKFFVKEIQFHRNFHSQKQQFCQKWGVDIYKITQSLFKKNTPQLNTSLKNPLFGYDSRNRSKNFESFEGKEIGFDSFYEFGRKYQCYFNKSEFKAIWRRIKKVEEKIVLKPEEIFITQEDLANFLLVKSFNTKLKYANQYSIPFKNMQMPPPSYKLPISQDKIHNSYQYRQQQQAIYFDKKISQIRKQLHDPISYQLKQSFSYPEIQHNCVSVKLKQKQEDWKDVLKTMSNVMVDQKYQEIMDRENNFRVKQKFV